MGLAATLKTAVDKAFVAAGDLVTTLTYKDVTPGVYDPLTDAVSNTEVTYSSVPCILVKLKDDEVAWFPADAIVQKAIIPYNDLALVPEPHDYVIIDGVSWQIHKITPVPGRSVHILYIRKA